MGGQTDLPFSENYPSQMKWGLIYGIILCTARALGEFGAVNALSKDQRADTFTLPLEGDALYMSGQILPSPPAFAVSSILVIIAVIVADARNILNIEVKTVKGYSKSGYVRGNERYL